MFQKKKKTQGTTAVSQQDHIKKNRLQHKNASGRASSLFLKLLERQFLIESAKEPLKLRNVTDFAHELSINAYHLNRSIKEITEKSAITHITESIITEAKHCGDTQTGEKEKIAFSFGV